MKRLEIFGNQSVQEELVADLEKALPGFRYTLVPIVHGKGRDDWKMGTTVWPEENFWLVSYLSVDDAELAVPVLRELKLRYPNEGLKAYTSKASEEI